MKEPYLQLSSIGKIQVNRYLARQVFIVRTCGLLSPVNGVPMVSPLVHLHGTREGFLKAKCEKFK